ncbi:hypothetical protein KFL_001810080 [Klebsormidium nitens]|uniref:Cytochrome b561 domain-containing protein n=1 Tax=Klebsormidium nitens TaxID=105231 RepID=A0A1Y1I676_KLENI|nr:hypothetical protein KFL_001810080 [Klebsormidium nitens]|eukprot:GAQ84227.1 hypothetical protein KFL_001810080 [Klebsormidium nitens]
MGTLPLALTATFFSHEKILFAGHVLAMSAGGIFLMSEGIIAARNAKGKQRGLLLRLHLYIQAASLALAALGFIFIYSSRSMASKQHFTTLHTWVGLSALVGFLVIAAGGVLLYYGLPKRYKKFTGQLSRIHKLAGKVIFYVGLAAAFLALRVNDPEHHRHKGLWTYILAVWLVFVGFVVHDAAPIEVDLSWCHQLVSELRNPWLQAALRRVRSQNLNATEAAKKDDPVREGPEGKPRRSEEQRPVSTGSEHHQADVTDQV